MASPEWNQPTFRGWNPIEPVPGIRLPLSDLRQTSVFMQQEIVHHKAIYHVEDKHILLPNPICSSLTQSGFIHDYHFKNKAYSCDFDVTNTTSRSSDMNQVGVNTHIFNESKFNEGTDPKQCDSKCDPLKQELSLEQNDKDSTELNRDKAVSQLRNSDKESEKEDSNIPIIPVISVEDDNMEQGNILDDKTGLFVKEKQPGAEVEFPPDNAFKVSMTPETPRIVHNLDQAIKSNATISNCKVDPDVLQQIKKPHGVPSPLKLTKDMESMIDDYISSNISLFMNPSWLSECHSPTLSIETPLSTPNTSPELVSTSLSPVLSPIIMKLSNEKVKNHQLNPHPSKQKKKRSISGMKNLSSILPARHNHSREKSLFETAERFLGREMLSNKRKRRKVDKSEIFEPVNPIDISRDKGNLEDITGNNRDAPNCYTDKEAESGIISNTDEDEIPIQRDQKKVKEINKSVNCNKVKSVNKIPPFRNPKKNAEKPTKRKFDSTITYLQEQFETDRNKTEELLPSMDKNLEDGVKQEPPNDGQSSAKKKKHFPIVHVKNSTDFPNVLMEGRKPNTEEKEHKMVLRKKYDTTSHHYDSDTSGKGTLSSKENTSGHKFCDKVTIVVKDGIWSMNTSKSQSKKKSFEVVVDSQAVAANTVQKQSNIETEKPKDVSEIIPAELDESKVVKNEKVGMECKKQKKKKRQTDLSKYETSGSEPKGKMCSMKTSAFYNTYNRDVKSVDLNERKDDKPSMSDAVPCKKKNSKKGKQNIKLAEESQKKQGEANLDKKFGNNSTSKPESLKLGECQKNLTSTIYKNVKGPLKRTSETQNGTEVETCAENRFKKTSKNQAEFKESFRKVSLEKKKQVKRKTAKDCVKTNISDKTVYVSASNVTGEKTRKRNLPLHKKTDNHLVSKFVKDSKKASVAADRKIAISNFLKKISNIKKGCGKKKIHAKGVIQKNCRICNESFADLKLLNGHTAKAHQFRCTWCKIEFKDAEASKKHYFSHLKMSFSCYTCDMKFTNTSVYEQHMKSKKHAKRVQKVNNLQTGVSASQLQQCSHPVPVSASQLQQCSHPIPVCASQLQQCSHPIPVCASQLQQCSHPIPACATQLQQCSHPVPAFATQLQQLSHLIPVPSPVSSTCINNVIQLENVKEPSSNKGDMYLQQPSDTIAQFYTNLEQASQLSWCDLNVSDNSLEFYVQNVDNDTDCGQGYFASLNDMLALTGSRTEPDSEVFVENGKTFTVMSNSHQDITTPTTSGSSNTICVADVTSAEVSGLDLSSSGMDDNDTAPICRIANSFSLLPYLQNNK